MRGIRLLHSPSFAVSDSLTSSSASCIFCVFFPFKWESLFIINFHFRCDLKDSKEFVLDSRDRIESRVVMEGEAYSKR